MSKLLNVSSSPHVRNPLTTGKIMFRVILALLPVTVLGIVNYGMGAFLIIAASVLSAVATEWLFQLITKRKQTIWDGSAVVTGLLLALVLPPKLPLYIPIMGSVFAILVVKCLFGGLGHNFMNPALAARCFLLLSFGPSMTAYSLDGVTTATPLAEYAVGESVQLMQLLFGSASGVIGSSVLGILIGAAMLFGWKIISFEIPAAFLGTFTLFIAIFGGHGFNPEYLLVHLMGGGILLGAFFMATDYVTSPVTKSGQLVYGGFIGILCGLFRVFGNSADSVSYGIILGNMVVPLIEEFTIPTAYGHRKKKEPLKLSYLKPALVLGVITLTAGAALSGAYTLTKERIAEQKLAAQMAAYEKVCPNAVEFISEESIDQAVQSLDGEVYGTDFGRVYMNQVVLGKDAEGEITGYLIDVTSADGYDGEITMIVGLDPEGAVTGIEFTEISESAGMGMLVTEEAFKSQFEGVKTDRFVLLKSGGSSKENEIDSVSGASLSSGAVTNAVNGALDFYEKEIR